MTNKKAMSPVEWTHLVLGVAIVFGSIVRFLPGLMAGFPLNDGGMFLSMIRDLADSRYALPEFTSYNQLQIPFAYPPFGFYVARLLSDLLNIPELDLLRWLPPLVNSLSILAFYLLASELLKSKLLSVLASAFYALTPGAFGWFVMGGGLTRSFGSLFLLLAVFSVLRLFQTGQGKFVGLAALFCGLTVLSHPEAGVHTAATCFLVWLFFGRTVKSFVNAVIVGVGVVLVTSPWWGTILAYHGLAPFLSALSSGSYGIPVWRALTGMILGRESYIPILAVLRLIGLGWGIWKKEYFLVTWAVVPYLVEPRSAPSVVFYPFCMLIALAFAEAIPFFASRLRKIPVATGELYKSKTCNALLFLVLIYLFVESGLYGFRLVNNSLKPAEVEAMTWIKENTPEGASFLILTGVKSPEIDPFIEWFPALVERRSLSTVQGYEWLGPGRFMGYYSDLAALQGCELMGCVEDWLVRTGLDHQYVVVHSAQVDDGLSKAFAESGSYRRIYNEGKIEIYESVTP
ncbi:MAG: hypothetical protein HND47_14105 [Chloroflexi bacterium]|nr:hypothetical protein [Chloroflexota bacterium]